MAVSLSAAEYDSLLETLPDIVMRYVADLTVSYVNGVGAAFFGADRDDIIGQPLTRFTSPDGARTLKADLANITADTPALRTIRKHQSPERTRFIQWTSIGLFENGELTGYQSIGIDITSERTLKRQLESRTAELAATQGELRAVLDAVPARIFYKDDKNTILRLNRAAAESMGMTVEEVEGRNTYDLFGDAAKQYHEDDLRVFESGEPIRGLIEPYTPDGGTPGWLQTDKLLLDDGSNEPRLLAVATDITDLKEKEAILTSINKNLDDFASMVSHDLQAPLRKIGITAELMTLELGDTLPDSATAYLDDIAAGVTHMRQLIRSFLKFMRGSPNKADLGPTSLNDVLRQVAGDVDDALAETDGTLTLPDRQITVRGDAPLLRQVFGNLVENALKYAHPDRSPRITISARPDHQFWILEVSDNGSGVDPNRVKGLFDLFERAREENSDEGFGVGLALCRRIIALHGGAIRLIKTDEIGSAFELTLFRSGDLDYGD